jgi:hypothetical protein
VEFLKKGDESGQALIGAGAPTLPKCSLLDYTIHPTFLSDRDDIPVLSGPASSNSPARFQSPVHKNTRLKSFKFPHREKAYIPAPKEHEIVAKTTINEKPLKRK